MVVFIDQYRSDYGVEPICQLLPIAPSTYHRCKTLEPYPAQRTPGHSAMSSSASRLGVRGMRAIAMMVHAKS